MTTPTTTGPAAAAATCPSDNNAGRVPCGLSVTPAGPGRGTCPKHGLVALATTPVGKRKARKLARISAEAAAIKAKARAAKPEAADEGGAGAGEEE